MTAGRRSGRWPRRAPDIVALVGVPLARGRAPSTTPPRCWPAGESSGWYRKIWLPNYAVFDEKRYFTPGERVLVARASTASGSASTSARTSGRTTGPAKRRLCRGGRRGHQPVHVALPPGKGSEREAMLAGGRRPPVPTSATSTASAVRTSWCSTARAWSSTRGAAGRPGRPVRGGAAAGDVDLRSGRRPRDGAPAATARSMARGASIEVERPDRRRLRADGRRGTCG